MNKTHTELTLELLLENLRTVKLNFESKPFEIAIIHLTALIEAYEEQLKKAQDQKGNQDD